MTWSALGASEVPITEEIHQRMDDQWVRMTVGNWSKSTKEPLKFFPTLGFYNGPFYF